MSILGNNNGRSPEHFVIEEIAVGDCTLGDIVVPCVSPTLLPLGSPVQTVSRWQNVMYDMYVPHYGQSMANFRPTRLSVRITTTMNSSKIQVQTQFNIACHTSSHVCKWSLLHSTAAMPIRARLSVAGRSSCRRRRAVGRPKQQDLPLV